MAYTAGELRPLYGVKETEYGKTPSGALDYYGELISAAPNIEPNQSIEYWSGGRSYAPASCVFERWDPALRVQVQPRVPATGYDWMHGLLEAALGAMSGTTPLDRLPSYSLLVELTQGAAIGQYLYNGCKVHSLSLSVDKPGGKVLLDAELHASYISKVGAARAVTGLQALTLGAGEAPPSSPPLQWRAPTTLVAGSSRTIYPQRLKVDIANNLQRQGGSVPGADSAGYSITTALHEGRREISAEVELYLEDLVIMDEMLANQSVASLSTVIGGKTITLQGGHYIVDGGAWPELRHDVMTQTVRMRFSSVAVAGV